MMNLHIFPDDKFIDAFIVNWEKTSPAHENVYAVRKNKPFIYVKNEKVISIAPNSESFTQFIDQCKTYDTIYIHQLRSDLYNLILALPDSMTVCWVFWGVGFFNVSHVDYPLYKRQTSRLKSKEERFNIPALRDKFWLFRNRSKLKKRYTHVLQRIDYILHFNKYDVGLIRKAFPTFTAKHLEFFYPFNLPLESLGLEQKSFKRPSVLLGNSGHRINNHIDAMNELRKNSSHGLDFKEIYCPLSYGEKPYIEAVNKKGKEWFGDRFVPLTEYMDFKSYAEILNKCKIGIMNHNRSAGLGNIILMLFLGKTLFLDKKNPAYQFLKSNGVKLFTLDELCVENLELSSSEVRSNVAIISSLFSESKVLTNFKNIQRTLKSSKEVKFSEK